MSPVLKSCVRGPLLRAGLARPGPPAPGPAPLARGPPFGRATGPDAPGCRCGSWGGPAIGPVGYPGLPRMACPGIPGPAEADGPGTCTRGTGADGWSGYSAGGGAFHCGQGALSVLGGQSATACIAGAASPV